MVTWLPLSYRGDRLISLYCIKVDSTITVNLFNYVLKCFHPHTQAESGAYLRDSSRVPRCMYSLGTNKGEDTTRDGSQRFTPDDNYKNPLKTSSPLCSDPGS